MNRIVFWVLVLSLTLLFATPSCAGVYEGPNGEVYMGDYLPQELAEKGYVPKGAKRGGTDRKKKAAARSDRTDGITRLALPGKTWALELKTEGFKVKNHEISPDGKNLRFAAGNEKDGMIMSMFLEEAPGKGDSRAARDYYWGKIQELPYKKDNVKMYEQGQIALSEHFVKEFRGQTLDQKHIHAYLVKDDIWIDVHVSKVLFKDGDDRYFDEILDTVRINDNYEPTVFQYFKFATSFNRHGRYKDAIFYYLRVMEAIAAMENPNNPVLKMMLLVSVDNMGLAYAATGNLEQAKKVFEGGISMVPGYPMFYYNLACVYSEMGKLNSALENLEKAYNYKGKMIPGEEFPDPARDPSFKRFAKDKKFLEAIEKFRRL
jgi:hypothetical protein